MAAPAGRAGRVRIVAGRHRGRRLATPRGGGVRPTSERVREALFDVLAHNAWGPGGAALPGGARVIDGFAASGALGFEALSRGAVHATFLETDADALRVIAANAEVIGESENVAVLSRDATRPGPAERACALAFLDPPYRSGLVPRALEALAREGWLEGGALAVVELAANEPFAPPPGFAVIDDRRYGSTRVVFVRWSGERGSPPSPRSFQKRSL